MAKELLSFNDLSAFGISYSRARVYALMKAGRFPKQVKIGPFEGRQRIQYFG
jgi:predicted DNA-binding transcriptional regulator AlpA